MSRRSQAFAEGVQKFSWRVERVTDGRYKAESESHPGIVAFGDTEQQAMTAAKDKIYDEVTKATLGE